MAGFEQEVDAHYIRMEIWSRQLKEMLLDDLMSMKFTTVIEDGSPVLMAMSIKEVVILGVAATVASNPIVSRRNLFGLK